MSDNNSDHSVRLTSVEVAESLVLAQYLEWRQTYPEDKRQEITHAYFCRCYTWGYWAAGNSAYDLLDMFWESDKSPKEQAFKTFREIAVDLIECEISVGDAIASLRGCMAVYGTLQANHNWPIVE